MEKLTDVDLNNAIEPFLFAERDRRLLILFTI